MAGAGRGRARGSRARSGGRAGAPRPRRRRHSPTQTPSEGRGRAGGARSLPHLLPPSLPRAPARRAAAPTTPPTQPHCHGDRRRATSPSARQRGASGRSAAKSPRPLRWHPDPAGAGPVAPCPAPALTCRSGVPREQPGGDLTLAGYPLRASGAAAGARARPLRGASPRWKRLSVLRGLARTPLKAQHSESSLMYINV